MLCLGRTAVGVEVSSRAGIFLLDREFPEPADKQIFSTGEGVLHNQKEPADELLGFTSLQAQSGLYVQDQVFLRNRQAPPVVPAARTAIYLMLSPWADFFPRLFPVLL